MNFEFRTPQSECKHEGGVLWNPYNERIQCHKCGQIFVEKPVLVNPAMGLEFVNTARWEPLGDAYASALRLTELHLAMAIVEECGASPELTEAIVRLDARLQLLKDKVAVACKRATGTLSWQPEDE